MNSVPGKVTASAPRIAMTLSTTNDTPQASDLDERERKKKLVRHMPLLTQIVKDQICTEDSLLDALKIVRFGDGEYIFCQGNADKAVYFIDEGKVMLTQRRTGAPATPLMKTAGRRRSMMEAETEIHVMTHEEHQYFGEMALLQNTVRMYNAIAMGTVTCMILEEVSFASLLGPVHSLMLYRHLLRSFMVLDKERLFKDFSLQQKQYVIDHCQLEKFAKGDYICRQGDTEDKRFFIIAEGEADIVLEEKVTSTDDDLNGDDNHSGYSRSNSLTSPSTTIVQSGARGNHICTSVVAHKSLYQGFGEMGLLDKPRAAHAIAVSSDGCLCIVITRKVYIAAGQLLHAAIDVDAESLLATTLIEEWNLVVNARNLHLSNPRVAHYLITFIQHFKSAYSQKFVGKTVYLDFLRRLHQEPQLGDEFAFLSSRITWDSPSSSLSIIRSETRRVLSLPTAQRNPFEMSFIGRLIEHTAFMDKFDVPSNVDKFKVARVMGKIVEFLNIGEGMYLFRQGKIESKAYLILRGQIHIVNEDMNSLHTSLKHYEIIATLSAGDSFGELSLVTRLQRSATTLAASDTDLLVIDRDHLATLSAALPGVSFRHLMVERAEFLAKLAFFKNCDFGQCIRVAHDTQETIYEPRHLFLQEPVHLRTLYIVRSGEVAVFLKKKVSASTLGGSATLPSGSTTAANINSNQTGTNATTATSMKTVLVRVATIGPQEFFGVTIVSVNTAPMNGTALPSNHAGSSSASGNSGNTPTSIGLLPAFGSPNTNGTVNTYWDLASTTFMCCTRVQVLELSERGWRRLSPQSLQIIRNCLLERSRWNHETVDKLKDPSYYHVDKPWQMLTRPSVETGKPSDHHPRPTTQLARHLQDKQKHAEESQFLQYFPKAETPRRPVSVSTAKQPFVSALPVSPIVSWGWQQPVSSSLGGSFSSLTSSKVSDPVSLVPQPPVHASALSSNSSVNNQHRRFIASSALNRDQTMRRFTSPISRGAMVGAANIAHRKISATVPRMTKSADNGMKSAHEKDEHESIWRLQRQPTLR